MSESEKQEKAVKIQGEFNFAVAFMAYSGSISVIVLIIAALKMSYSLFNVLITSSTPMDVPFSVFMASLVAAVLIALIVKFFAMSKGVSKFYPFLFPKSNKIYFTNHEITYSNFLGSRNVKFEDIASAEIQVVGAVDSATHWVIIKIINQPDFDINLDIFSEHESYIMDKLSSSVSENSSIM